MHETLLIAPVAVTQKTFRYLWRFYSLLFRGFFVALFGLEKECSGPFRYLFVVFSWLFRGPRFGQILRVLALEQSSTPLPRKGRFEDNLNAVGSPFWRKGPKIDFPQFYRLLTSRGHFYSLAEAY